MCAALLGVYIVIDDVSDDDDGDEVGRLDDKTCLTAAIEVEAGMAAIKIKQEERGTQKRAPPADDATLRPG